MFIRTVTVKGVRHMHIVHTYRQGHKTKHLTIATLGRYDQNRFEEVQALLRDWQRLERSQVVVDDLLAPGRLLKELREFTAREAGLGPVVARQLVEEVITLRNICCPRIRELKPGEMPLVVTHVSARLSEDRATRFRRLAPVIITVWTPEELVNPPQDVRECLELLKRRIVRVCFEAYRQNGLLTLMDLQWVFQLPSVRISELIRSVQREHNLVVPTPGTILDAAAA
ncbi:MAG: DUF1670 domain-containing protein [Clostridia bacterium]|nr:DUF1670 domain-containing protein [Clostridia bacterium]